MLSFAPHHELVRVILRFSTLLLASLSLLIASGTSRAELLIEDEQWKRDYEKDGVVVYTRPFPGSDFQAFKAVYTLEASIEDIMAVMSDPTSCTEWVLNCVESWGFDDKQFSKRHAYSVNDLPWPVMDRDYVLEINTSKASDSDTIVMDLYAVDDKIAPNKSYVRVSKQETHYHIKPLGDEQTEIVWLQHTEPGGAIPSWLVNALIVDIPFKSLKALESLANSDKYQDHQIQYSDDGEITGVEKQP
ncbi:START domain-containing protein [Allohahella marinimesophila]|uniref:START domain-containing protein n=1 Tax=Allohahella marinimesophila TaxID=1054972 RepID=A0ABP7Q3V8_9GAMM